MKREKITIERERGAPKRRVPHRPTKRHRPKKGGGYDRAAERRRLRKETGQ